MICFIEHYFIFLTVLQCVGLLEELHLSINLACPFMHGKKCSKRTSERFLLLGFNSKHCFRLTYASKDAHPMSMQCASSITFHSNSFTSCLLSCHFIIKKHWLSTQCHQIKYKILAATSVEH